MTLYRFSFTHLAKKLLIFVILSGAVINTSSAQSQRPNIIYIMADDLGYADLSCYGRKDYSTPNIDKLASQGMKFMNAYAGASLCTPTRVSFMTGRYPARLPVGLYEPLRGSPKDSVVGLKREQTSVATLVRNAGYETALIGKWHLGFTPEHGPNANGFEEFLGFHPGATDYVTHRRGNGKPDLYHNTTSIEEDGYITDILTEHALQYIKKKHSKPFFLSLQFNAPHWPWQGPGDKAYPDTLRWPMGGSPIIFQAMMKSLDSAVGLVMKAVDEANLSGNTVIIFTSDNGGEKFSDMGIYSGAKAELWDGGIRVPAVIKWTGKIKPNTTTDQVIVTMDWTATILALAGAKPDPALPLDGENILSVCNGSKKVYSRTLYWRMFQDKNQKAVRDGNWKYLLTEQGESLFDLSTDPSEKNNLKEKHPEIFTRLKAKYAEWEKTVLKPIPL
jgi:arylsulfatase A-like enzyme